MILYSINLEHHLTRDNALSSRFGESLPIMNANHEQITQIGSNLSRFPDGSFDIYSQQIFIFYIDFTNLNDDNLDNASPIIISTTGSTGQTNPDKDQNPSVDTNSELEKLEQPKIPGRWDEAWEEHEKQLEQQENNEIPPKSKQLNTPRLTYLIDFQTNNLMKILILHLFIQQIHHHHHHQLI